MEEAQQLLIDGRLRFQQGEDSSEDCVQNVEPLCSNVNQQMQLEPEQSAEVSGVVQGRYCFSRIEWDPEADVRGKVLLG